MSALTVWNGGVILISHDERFITSVAKEVSENLFVYIGIYSDPVLSFGFAQTAPLPSSRATSRLTRFVDGPTMTLCPLVLTAFPESHCQQHQSKTLERCSVRRFSAKKLSRIDM